MTPLAYRIESLRMQNIHVTVWAALRRIALDPRWRV